MSASDSRDALIQQSSESKRLHDALNHLRAGRELMKDRLSLEWSFIRERYLKGDLYLRVYWRIADREALDYVTVFQGWTASNISRECENERVAEKVRGRVSEISHVASQQSGDLMLISKVSVIDEAKEVVPTRIWCGTASDLERCFYAGLFCSPKSGFQFVRGITEREVDLSPSVVPVRMGLSCPTPDDIENRPQVMQCVSRDRAPNRFDTCASVDPSDVLGPLRIWLNDEYVRLELSEGADPRCKIADILFGPFDLNSAAGRPVSPCGHRV